MDEPGTQASEGERELASRRKDLEREFDDKQRDLKAQHKRQADKLQADRVDWEASRKTQLKDLADRTERVKRQEDNHAKDLAALKEAQRRLDLTRSELEEHRTKKADVAEAKAGESASRKQLRASHSLLAFASFVAVAGGAASLLGAVLWDRAVAYVAAGLTLGLGLLAEWRRRRFR